MKSVPQGSEVDAVQIHTKVKVVVGISALDAMVGNVWQCHSRDTPSGTVDSVKSEGCHNLAVIAMGYSFPPLVPRTFFGIDVGIIVRPVCVLPSDSFCNFQLIQNRGIQHIYLCINSYGVGTVAMSAYLFCICRSIMAIELVLLFCVTNENFHVINRPFCSMDYATKYHGEVTYYYMLL